MQRPKVFCLEDCLPWLQSRANPFDPSGRRMQGVSVKVVHPGRFTVAVLGEERAEAPPSPGGPGSLAATRHTGWGCRGEPPPWSQLGQLRAAVAGTLQLLRGNPLLCSDRGERSQPAPLGWGGQSGIHASSQARGLSGLILIARTFPGTAFTLPIRLSVGVSFSLNFQIYTSPGSLASYLEVLMGA